MTKVVSTNRPPVLGIVAGAMLVSGALYGGMGLQEATASDLEATSAETSEICAPNDTPAALVEALQNRSSELDARQDALDTRSRELDAAQNELQAKLNELREAKDALAATLAIADQAAEKDLAQLTAVYEAMKPVEAAKLFSEMDPEFAAGFLGRMAPSAAAGILTGLAPDEAYAISAVLAGRNASAPTE